MFQFHIRLIQGFQLHAKVYLRQELKFWPTFSDGRTNIIGLYPPSKAMLLLPCLEEIFNLFFFLLKFRFCFCFELILFWCFKLYLCAYIKNKF